MNAFALPFVTPTPANNSSPHPESKCDANIKICGQCGTQAASNAQHKCKSCGHMLLKKLIKTRQGHSYKKCVHCSQEARSNRQAACDACGKRFDGKVSVKTPPKRRRTSARPTVSKKRRKKITTPKVLAVVTAVKDEYDAIVNPTPDLFDYLQVEPVSENITATQVTHTSFDEALDDFEEEEWVRQLMVEMGDTCWLQNTVPDAARV